MKKKSSTLIPHVWLKALKKVPKETCADILMALIELDSTGELPNFEPGSIEDVLFSQYAETVIENKKNYDEQCRNRSEAAKKREAQKTQLSKESTVVGDMNRYDMMRYDVMRYDMNDISKDSYQKESIDLSEEFTNPKLNKAFSDYLQYRNVSTDIEKDRIKDKLAKLANCDEDLMIKILDQSIEQGWKGLFPLKQETHKPARKEGWE